MPVERTHAETLIECGEKLPESAKPSPADLYNLLAGLLFWLETGGTDAPEPAPEPDSATSQKDAEIERLKAELSAAEAAAPAASLSASPVAPGAPQPGPEVAEPKKSAAKK
jgi:hypothetical protein